MRINTPFIINPNNTINAWGTEMLAVLFYFSLEKKLIIKEKKKKNFVIKGFIVGDFFFFKSQI